MEKEALWLNQAQAIGAQAVTGAFRSVATAVAEAEAGIAPVLERHAKTAAKNWVNLRTLPREHPLARLNMRICRRFTSPMQKMAELYKEVAGQRLEVIQEFACSLLCRSRQGDTTGQEGARRGRLDELFRERRNCRHGGLRGVRDGKGQEGRAGPLLEAASSTACPSLRGMGSRRGGWLPTRHGG
ncbi:reverse transcriptase [Metarhizium brunneum]